MGGGTIETVDTFYIPSYNELRGTGVEGARFAYYAANGDKSFLVKYNSSSTACYYFMRSVYQDYNVCRIASDGSYWTGSRTK